MKKKEGKTNFRCLLYIIERIALDTLPRTSRVIFFPVGKLLACGINIHTDLSLSEPSCESVRLPALLLAFGLCLERKQSFFRNFQYSTIEKHDALSLIHALPSLSLCIEEEPLI